MTYNVNKTKILDYKTVIYVAAKMPSIIDEYENEKPQYAQPIKYIFNIQPVNADSEIREFGELANQMKVATINKLLYDGLFHEYDKAYINTTPDGEVSNGFNADYQIYSVRPQNSIIKVYFKKIDLGGYNGN